jgi:hypothetical protein
MTKLFFAMLFIGSVTIAFAELPSIGVKAGLNYSKLHFATSVLESDWKPGFEGGVFVHIPIKSWYIQPEVLFVNRSFRYHENPFYSSQYTDQNLHTNYICIPIYAGYKFFDKEPFKIRLFVGCDFGFLLDNKNTTPSTTIKHTSGINISRSDVLSDYAISGSIGLGYDIKKFTIDFKYGYVFNKLIEHYHQWTNQYVGVINGSPHLVSFSIGYKIL